MIWSERLFACEILCNVTHLSFHTRTQAPTISTQATTPMVFVNDADSIHAIHLHTGKVLSSHIIGSNCSTMVQVAVSASGGLFVSCGRTIYGFGVNMQTRVWNFTADDTIRVPRVDEVSGSVYFGTDSGRVYKLVASSGSKSWSFMAGQAVRAPLAVTPSFVYAFSMDGVLHAISQFDGSTTWKFLTGDDFTTTSGPVVVNDTVVLAGQIVYAVDARKGTLLWARAPTSEAKEKPGLSTTPVVSGDNLIIGSRDADSGTGSINWMSMAAGHTLHTQPLPAEARGVAANDELAFVTWSSSANSEGGISAFYL